MPKLSKKSTLLIGVVALVLVITGVAIFFITKNSQVQTVAPVVTQAELYKAQALEALNNNDAAAAKDLFEKAQAQYDEISAPDETVVNDQVDIEAQLWLINHPSTPSSTAN
jgi:outer membrane protein assembly factor BamD (BamD/ComL family)